MSSSRLWGLGFVCSLAVLGSVAAQQGAQTKSRATSDLQLVKSLLECRGKYQESLEQLRLYYLSAGDLEKARWAEEELRQYHRISKQSYRLDLEVPVPILEAKKNIPDANQL